MIPLRDDIPSRTYPIINVALILANLAVFLYEVLLGRELSPFIHEFAVIPARYFHSALQTPEGWIVPISSSDRIVPLFTSIFMHGGWVHLIGNMLYLWIFGDNVEDRMGHARYLFFYLLCGLTASLAHIWANPNSTLPSLGASGAIAGVLGAYLLLYPYARVVVLLPILFFIQFVEVPAPFFLIIWFLQQFVTGALTLGIRSAQTGGVAWWAHIGGFIAGAVLVGLFARKRHKPSTRDRWWQDLR